MKIVVLGAGVVGVTLAHFLSEDGHDVEVIDRQPGPALEASFGNAGGVCPSFAGPWAAPGMPFKVLKWMLTSSGPLVFRPRFSSRQWRWLLQFVLNCSPQRFAVNKQRMQRIAHYSKARLVKLRQDTGISYDERTGGVLQTFVTQQELEGGTRSSAVLSELGIDHRLVDAREAARIEPCLLHARKPFAGGLYLPDDEVGDCHRFTSTLAGRLAGRGVLFRYGTTIRNISVFGGKVESVDTSSGSFTADAYVVALGAEAPLLLSPIGVSLPVYPLKGYSLTAPIVRDEMAPGCAIMDEHTKIMASRLGNRLRVAGMAELGGYDRGVPAGMAQVIREISETLFPFAADYEAATFWSGLRPMTPDGPPFLGSTPIANLFLNAGQGSNGWTQACGCGRIVADIIGRRSPEIDISGLTLETR
ncbi:D-amino acid dehydrogenase [Mesorhizobium sp. NPDC059054]|uniref:D-amino acid dehydrogenase n=1 Tax=Mesorhizobium sp. NPDC059054 TaxID=3346711 RepID=UPI0036C8C6A8